MSMINYLLPARIREHLNSDELSNAEELRLRLGKHMGIVSGGREHTTEIEIDDSALSYVLEKASGASVHAVMDTLCEGYLSFRGIRIGVCGTAVTEHERVVAVKNFSSLSIRIPREYKSILDGLYPSIDKSNGCLIISAPGVGKTTALRELVRRLSVDGYRISVADERNEIAAKDGALIQLDVGEHTDVLTGMKKAPAIMTLMRGMNPQFIAVDEISRREDAEAILEAGFCGVRFLATAHASGLDELKHSAVYSRLLKDGVFSDIILITQTGAERSYKLL